MKWLSPVSRVLATAVLATAALAFVPACDTNGPSGPSILLGTAVITAPLDGFAVLGRVTVRAEVGGFEAPAWVDLYVDGAKFTSDAASPWEFAWDTSDPDMAVASEHELQVVAFDSAGRTRRSDPITVTLGERSFGGSYGLFVVNADGTNLRCLVALDVFPISPDVSPDGRRIAITGYTGDVDGDGLILPGGDDMRAEIFMVNADGAGLERKSTNDFIETDVRWSADGLGFFFATNRGSGANLEIFTERVFGSPNPINKTVTPGASERFPIEVGDLIYHARHDAGGDPGAAAIFTVRRTAPIFTQLTDPGFDAAAPSWLPIGDLSPDLSPDGLDLAFSRSIGGTAGSSTLGDVRIVVRHLADGAEADLGNGVGADLFPRWSPDGSVLLLVSWNDLFESGGRLVLLNPSTGVRTAIGPLPANLRPIQAAWFPSASLGAADATPDIVFAAAHVNRLE